MLRALWGLSLTALVFGTGCDISAKPFSGTVLQMSILGAQPLPADNHLEFWARTANDDIARLSTIYETTARGRVQTMVNGELIDPRGFVIVPAITMGDQCMIDDKGNLMTTAGAWKPTVIFDTPQTPDEIAAQILQNER